jgi:hypothetical protein
MSHQIHVTPLEQARAAYAEAGLPAATTYAHPWRHPTPAEHAAASVAVQQSGWLLDERGQQLRLDVVRGELVVLRVPCVHSENGPVWRGLQPYLKAAPAIEAHDQKSTTYVFKQRAGAPIPEIRFLELVAADGPGFERVAPVTEREPHGGVRLPHAGMYERLIQAVPSTGVPELPAELAPLTMSTCVVSPDLIQEWLDRHYEKIGVVFGRAKPTTRAEVYREFLIANNLLESQINEQAFGGACHGARCFDSKRTKDGIAWLITRKADVTFGPMRGVEAFTLSAVDLAEFLQWKHSVELVPERVRARKEAATAAKQRAEQAAYVAALFGTREVLEEVKAADYFQYHHRFEAERAQTCTFEGEAFVELSLSPQMASRLTPEAWARTRGMKHRTRYDALVRHYVDGVSWDQIAGAQKGAA